jgi:hypothetical protein
MRPTWFAALLIVLGGSGSELTACSCTVPGAAPVEVDCAGALVLTCGGAAGSFEFSQRPPDALAPGLKPGAEVAELLSAPQSAGSEAWGNWLEIEGKPLAEMLSQPLVRSLIRPPRSSAATLRLRPDFQERWSPLLSRLFEAR